MIKRQSKILILAMLIFNVAISFSQKINIDSVQNLIDKGYIEEAKIELNKFKKNNQVSNINLGDYLVLKAEIFLAENKDELALEKYQQAREIFINQKLAKKKAKTDLKILSLLVAREEQTEDYNLYLKGYLEYSKNENDPRELREGYNEIGKLFYGSNHQLALNYFRKALKEANKIDITEDDRLQKGKILQNIGAYYAHDEIKKLDSSLIYYNKAFGLYQTVRNNEEQIFGVYTNKGIAYSKLKDFENAIKNFKAADQVKLKKYINKSKLFLYNFMSNTYSQFNDYKNAYYYTQEANEYQNLLNEENRNIAIKDINAKYKTLEKEKENIELRSKNDKNRTLIIVIVLISAILVLSFYFYNRNLVHKKKIQVQNKQLEISNLENQLKENQLYEIDKLLEAQENERHKIADELHDNLGSLLATLKINFEAIHNNQKKDDILLNKMNQIIDEAYKEVRNIAHIKKVGISSKDGLLNSVFQMAEKMSVKGKLVFNIIPFGLEIKLENSLELLIFRVIQELSTNIIKHSKATEANIYINQLNDNELNIIIEDNGIGFDYTKYSKNNGIGLKSIEQKIEQLKGNFTVDSKIGKGTTIVIELFL